MSPAATMRSAEANRLLVLGFDSMDVSLVRRWANEGSLPTFRRLFETAAWTEYLDPPEYVSGVHWPSINSGLGPLRTDFWYPVRLCPGTYRIRMSGPEDIRGEPFWKWFAEAGRRIVLFDVPFLAPTEAYGGRQV